MIFGGSNGKPKTQTMGECMCTYCCCLNIETAEVSCLLGYFFLAVLFMQAVSPVAFRVLCIRDCDF